MIVSPILERDEVSLIHCNITIKIDSQYYYKICTPGPRRHDLEHGGGDRPHGARAGQEQEEPHPQGRGLQRVHLLHGGQHRAQGLQHRVRQVAGGWRCRKYLVALTKIFEDRGEHLLRAAPPPELDDVRRERCGDRVQPQVCSDLITGTNIVTNNDLHCVTWFYLTAPRSGRCRSRCGASRRGTPPSPTATSPAPSTGCNLCHG